MRLSLRLSVAISLAAGLYIDWWKKAFPNYELFGYSIIFIAGYAIGMFGVYFISTIPEPRMTTTEGKINVFRLISEPIRDLNYRALLVFLGSWNFAVNLAAPFFTVYMLSRLQMSISFVIAVTALSQLVNQFFLRVWGKVSDLFSSKAVLGLSVPLFSLCILGWTFTTMPERHIFTIPLLICIHVFLGIAMAGVNLACGNIGLKLAPMGKATSYLAASSLVNSFAAGVAPVLGGMLAEFFAERELSWTLKWASPGREISIQTLSFRHWDFFFFIAFLVGLYAIHRLAMVKEVGAIDEDISVHELLSEVRMDMRNCSTVGGLRQMVLFPFSVARHLVSG